MTNQELFDILFQQFLIINSNRDMLIKEATTAEQASQVLEAWRRANLNQLTMGNKILSENTAELQEIVKNLKAVQKEIDEALEDLKETAEKLEKLNTAISAISKAVALGAKLVALA